MDLSFSSKELRQICEIEAKSKSKLGREVSRKLRSRLADLVAAESLEEFPASFYDLHKTESGQVEVRFSLGEEAKLLCQTLPSTQMSKTEHIPELSRVRRLKVQAILMTDRK